jgi:hypothetical protein
MRDLLAFTLILAVVFSGCKKSDRELEEALVGTWNEINCPNVDPNDWSLNYWFTGFVSFRADKSFTESISWQFCKDSCEMPASDPMEFCTCNYYVENGNLVVVAEAENPEGHFVGTTFPYLIEIPIKK